MPKYIRLVYASRASFPVPRDSAGIHPEVARILTQSRRNNPRRGLVGALYFGDGCFFQCIEGPVDEVESLYHRLQGDPRHTDLLLLSRQAVSEPVFSSWSMKLVPDAAQVRDLMARRGRTTFDPYSFDESLQAEVVALLLKGPDARLPALDIDGGPGGPLRAARPGWVPLLGLTLTALLAAGLAYAWMH